MKKRSRITGSTLCGILLLFLVLTPGAYPAGLDEGYDENTEVTITGTIMEIFRERGPVIVRVASRGRNYDVCTGPPWFIQMENVNFTPGAEVEMTGSKMVSPDGTLSLILRRLKDIKTGKEVQFRDDFLRPLWRGKRHPGGNGGR